MTTNKDSPRAAQILRAAYLPYYIPVPRISNFTLAHAAHRTHEQLRVRPARVQVRLYRQRVPLLEPVEGRRILLAVQALLMDDALRTSLRAMECLRRGLHEE